MIEWFREMIDSGRVTWEHALRRAMRMNRTRTAAVRRSPKGPGSATIVQADIRTWRPDDIDAVLTDPPYVTDDALELYEELARFGEGCPPSGGICAAMVWTPMLADALRVMK